MERALARSAGLKSAPQTHAHTDGYESTGCDTRYAANTCRGGFDGGAVLAAVDIDDVADG